MNNNKSAQENLNLLNNFLIEFKFKDKNIREDLDHILVEINSLKLSTFKPKLELKSTILENILPDLKTNLTLNFENYEIRIEKKKIVVSYPQRTERLFSEFRFIPKFFSKFGDSEEKREKIEVSIKDINQIDEIVKLNLMQKLIEIRKPIELESIGIFSMIKPSNDINFDHLNQIIENQIKSNKTYSLHNFEINIKERENSYTIHLEKKFNFIVFFSNLKSNITWSRSILDLLNNNINKIKEIMEELKL